MFKIKFYDGSGDNLPVNSELWSANNVEDRVAELCANNDSGIKSAGPDTVSFKDGSSITFKEQRLL